MVGRERKEVGRERKAVGRERKEVRRERRWGRSWGEDRGGEREEVG